MLKEVHQHDAAGQVGGGLHGVRQPLGPVGADDQTVHHDLDVVLLVLLQGNVLGQVIEVSVGPDPDIAGAAGVVQHLGVLALAAPDHRGQHLDAGALRQGHDEVMGKCRLGGGVDLLCSRARVAIADVFERGSAKNHRVLGNVGHVAAQRG